MIKIESKIFENNDDDAIDAIFKYDKEKIESRYKAVATSDGINERKCESKVEYALLYFYQQFVALKDDKFDLAGFAQFLMRRVTMLPIVQSADGQEDAEIQNRGHCSQKYVDACYGLGQLHRKYGRTIRRTVL